MPRHDASMDVTVVLGKQGRLVIPAEVRRALGLVPGERLHLHLSGSRLVLERPPDAIAELRQLGAELARGRSLVDELLAERRSLPQSNDGRRLLALIQNRPRAGLVAPTWLGSGF